MGILKGQFPLMTKSLPKLKSSNKKKKKKAHKKKQQGVDPAAHEGVCTVVGTTGTTIDFHLKNKNHSFNDSLNDLADEPLNIEYNNI